jgi:hypothetical protein
VGRCGDSILRPPAGRPPHRDADASPLDHPDIVESITDGRDGFDRDAPPMSQPAQHRPFVDGRIEGFEQVDAPAADLGFDHRTPRLEHDPVSEILPNLIDDMGEFRTECGRADPDGVLKGLNLVHGLRPSSLDAMPFEPPSCGFAHRVAPDHPVVASRPGRILKQMHHMAMPTQTSGDGLNDLRMHDAAFERAAALGIVENRASGCDHDPGRVDGLQCLERFRPRPPRRHDDLHARGPRPLDGLTIHSGHPVTGEQGAVQIDGK